MSSRYNSEYLIQLNNVDFGYGSHRVLDDISLQINSGDFLAILGPNGSGKTTIIKIMLGLLNPKKGNVKIMGKSAQNFTEWEKIGYVSQKSAYFDPLFPVSVGEVVAMGCLSRRNSIFYDEKKEKESIDKALEYVGMKDFKSDRVGCLSLNQQRRICIARAIVNDPAILILDEPSIGIDKAIPDQIFDLLKNLNQYKKTAIVFVTSKTESIHKNVKQVAWLNKSLHYYGTRIEFFKSEVYKKMKSHLPFLFNHEC